MEVIVGTKSGFCGGVKLALSKAEEVVNENQKVYCLGEIVHNKQVIQNLEEKGMVSVNSIDEVPVDSKMIIRAHGEGEKVYEIAEEKGIEIIDTTCGNVKVIHNKIKKSREDSFIIIIGEKNHPEVIGHVGFAGENYYVIEEESDILEAYMAFENTGLSKVYAVAQTTYSSAKFDFIEEELYKNFTEADIIVDKTICNATEIRQNECVDIAKNVDYMIIIGGQNSANTRKLVEISKENCENVYFIQTLENIKGAKFEKGKKVGIMSGASTPDYITNEVKDYIEKL